MATVDKMRMSTAIKGNAGVDKGKLKTMASMLSQFDSNVDATSQINRREEEVMNPE